MPDIKQAQIYQSKILALEKQYLREIEQKRRELRRALADIISRDGVSRAAVQQMRREVDALKASLAEIARRIAKDVRVVNANFLRKQFQLAQRAGLRVPDPNAIIAAGAGKAIDGEEAYMTNVSAWVETLDKNLQLNAATLRISEASREEQLARLIAEDEEEGDGRASAYAYAGKQAQIEETRNLWTYAVGVLGAYLFIVNESQEEIRYRKQAIATIDERTTDCCLRVHGQIRDVDEPFRLTGTPRFADEVQDPPFHWNCRTTEVLYHEAFEQFGVTTDEMRDAARAELEAREKTKTRVPIYPSHATARRP